MQTFLPYASFTDTAIVLDNKRLGKQRVETLQILKALTIPEYGWKNHPAVKMWEGFIPELVNYGQQICLEWRSRGFNDTCLEKISAFSDIQVTTPVVPWITPELCLSHRSNLKRKDPEFYNKLFVNDPDNLPYIWPTQIIKPTETHDRDITDS